jgi:hypothetical protein
MKSTRRNFLKGTLAGLVTGGAVFSPIEKAVADTIYYGSYNPKEEQKVAYVEFSEISPKSKYVLPSKNDTRYNLILNQRNTSISNAISDVAGDFNGEYQATYDVVVEKDDPAVKGYVEITSKVIKRLKEIEK